jgi:hypothetical protein
MSNSPFPFCGSPIWLTLASPNGPVLLKSHVLGLGPDHSLLCSLAPQYTPEEFPNGLSCKGRSCIDGDIFDFESTIQGMLSTPPALRLEAPSKITKCRPRSYPRLSVNLPGMIRPLSEKGNILALLPMTFLNLSPTGCQIQVPASAWPLLSSFHVLLTCRLPGIPHYSKLYGSIEWVQPSADLLMGIHFIFQSEHDGAHKDILTWFTSQKARLVNTIA